MPFREQQRSPPPSEVKTDEHKVEWKVNSERTAELNASSILPSSSSSQSSSSIDDDDDDELPPSNPSLGVANTTQTSDRSIFMGSQISEVSSLSYSTHSPGSEWRVIVSDDELSDDTHENEDDDLPPEDDLPPPPTLVRQTGYYRAETSQSCSCLEPEERTLNCT